MKKLSGYLISLWNLIQYGFDFLTYHLVQSFDKFERQDAYKKRHPESTRYGRFKLYLQYNVVSKIDKRKSTLREQKAFVENLLLGLRFKKPDLQTIHFIANSNTFRPITRIRFRELAKDKEDRKMSIALQGKKILEEELIALIDVAEGNTQFDEMYTLIIEDLEDRIARQKALRKMMVFPIITVISLVITEIYVALSVLPMMTEYTVIEDFSSAPTISSYVELREALLNPSITYLFNALIVIAILVFVFSLNSTRWIIDLIAIMIPRLKTIIVK